MINNRTPNFDLPLPNGNNDLSVDVLRLAEALTLLDALVAGRATVSDLAETDAEVAALVTSLAQLTAAVDLKAPLASPELTGIPRGPTGAFGLNTTQLATAAFVQLHRPVVTEIATSQSWTNPGGGRLVFIELWSGGGGGANGHYVVNGNPTAGGRGGGGGGYQMHFLRASDLPGSVSVVIGAGGVANANGGDSTFGDVMKVFGGRGGSLGDGGGITLEEEAIGSFGGGDFSTSLHSVWGGGSGDRGGEGANGASGGSSAKGGGGGGGGAGQTWTTTDRRGGAGGKTNGPYRYRTTPAITEVGANGVDFGDGGNGGGSIGGGDQAAYGLAGGNGAIAGGGGGGGSSGTNISFGSGGSGGPGYCRVTVI